RKRSGCKSSRTKRAWRLLERKHCELHRSRKEKKSFRKPKDANVIGTTA
ncbi:hypothetical protein pipiens_020174, partial [Culex pipiens pipiens]